ncbi:hypothetical protein AAVH_12004 [Aphelenchoides avenae]|nr:hypothetical protein AAVH_12004 [Aphelenchus avenae]
MSGRGNVSPIKIAVAGDATRLCEPVKRRRNTGADDAEWINPPKRDTPEGTARERQGVFLRGAPVKRAAAASLIEGDDGDSRPCRRPLL